MNLKGVDGNTNGFIIRIEDWTSQSTEVVPIFCCLWTLTSAHHQAHAFDNLGAVDDDQAVLLRASGASYISQARTDIEFQTNPLSIQRMPPETASAVSARNLARSGGNSSNANANFISLREAEALCHSGKSTEYFNVYGLVIGHEGPIQTASDALIKIQLIDESLPPPGMQFSYFINPKKREDSSFSLPFPSYAAARNAARVNGPPPLALPVLRLCRIKPNRYQGAAQGVGSRLSSQKLWLSATPQAAGGVPDEVAWEVQRRQHLLTFWERLHGPIPLLSYVSSIQQIPDPPALSTGVDVAAMITDIRGPTWCLEDESGGKAHLQALGVTPPPLGMTLHFRNVLSHGRSVPGGPLQLHLRDRSRIVVLAPPLAEGRQTTEENGPLTSLTIATERQDTTSTTSTNNGEKKREKEKEQAEAQEQERVKREGTIAPFKRRRTSLPPETTPVTPAAVSLPVIENAAQCTALWQKIATLACWRESSPTLSTEWQLSVVHLHGLRRLGSSAALKLKVKVGAVNGNDQEGAGEGEEDKCEKDDIRWLGTLSVNQPIHLAYAAKESPFLDHVLPSLTDEEETQASHCIQAIVAGKADNPYYRLVASRICPECAS